MKKRGKKAGRKRFLAGLLSLCMVLTMIPVQAKASEAGTQSDESNTATVAGYDKNEINDTNIRMRMSKLAKAGRLRFRRR